MGDRQARYMNAIIEAARRQFTASKALSAAKNNGTGASWATAQHAWLAATEGTEEVIEFYDAEFPGAAK